MNKEIKSCANITKCIGTISEINLEFYQKDDNVIVRGAVILLVNNEYIRFNIFTNKKMAESYYTLLETIGIPYKFISSIDKDKYDLDIEPITVGMCGSVKIVKDKEILSRVDFYQSKRPTKLFIISNITEYGNRVTYISRANIEAKCGISSKLEGIPYKHDDNYYDIILPNANVDIHIVKIKCLVDLTIGKLYNFQLEWNKGYDIKDNIISNVETSGFQIVNKEELDYQYDRDTLRNMIKIYEIKNNN